MSHVPAKLPSDRSFCLWMAGFSGVAAVALATRGMPRAALACGLAAAALLAVGLIRPALAHPLNLLWLRFGLLLARVMNPLVLGLIFFLVITPVALLSRLTGRDELRLKPRRAQPSYWVARSHPQASAESFRQQY